MDVKAEAEPKTILAKCYHFYKGRGDPLARPLYLLLQQYNHCYYRPRGKVMFSSRSICDSLQGGGGREGRPPLDTLVLASSGIHCIGRYASYWDACLFLMVLFKYKEWDLFQRKLKVVNRSISSFPVQYQKSILSYHARNFARAFVIRRSQLSCKTVN